MQQKISASAKVLISSDLDGTLLDHYTYSFAPVVSTLEKLDLAGIPVILNTSKTAAEVKVIRSALKLTTPFIIENGAAIYIPKNTFKTKPKGSENEDLYWVKTFASPRSHWLKLIDQLEKDFSGQFESFSKMSLARISETTGLDQQDAALASNRQFGEPLLWKGNDAQRDAFIAEAVKLGASALLGGRFLHIGGDTNKGKALTWLGNEYKRHWDINELTTIALGDGNNDIAMLESADIAVRILSDAHAPPLLKRKDAVYTSNLTGPNGWREVIERIIPALQ